MYGAEHGFLLHTALMIGSWLVFLVMCAAPFALLLVGLGLKGWMARRRARP